ncbi:MAG: FHA domain-containing protein [Desulfatiglandales bacterium]
MKDAKNKTSSARRNEPLDETSYSLISSLFPSKTKILKEGQSYTIGRRKDSDILMPHEAISRRHARIEWRDMGFWIQDMGSMNGTIVNKMPIVKMRLADNDLIEIYPWRIRYKEFQGDINLLLGEETSKEATDLTQDLSETITKLPLPSGLSGTFRDIELLEICQLIEFCQKNGTLKIEGGGKEGIICFSMGVITWAQSNDLKGEKAAHELLSIHKGHFEFQGNVISQDERLVLKLSRILIDIMKEKDEKGVVEKTSLDHDLLKD